MPYQFTCPHCQTQTLVDDRYSGHVGRCVTCDQAIEVPEFVPEANLQTISPPGRTSPLVRRILAAVVCVLLIAGAFVFLQRYGGPAINSLSVGREQAIAVGNLKKIAAALNMYANDHSIYPAPIIRDATGKPMHSWRVAILPYLEERALFQSYDFDLPWDSDTNIALVDQMPSVYAATSSSNWVTNECFYQLVTGNRTLFPSSGPLGPKKMLDDPTKTALVVEAMPPKARQNLPGVWTEPVELDSQAMSGLIGSNLGVEIGGITQGGVAIATVDGEGHFLENTMAPEIVIAILTASGGEPLADDVLD